MALAGSGAFGNLKNKAGSDGKNLLDARVNQESLFREIGTAILGVTGCTPNIHDIYYNFPKWIQERDSDSNLIEFLQSYYTCTEVSNLNKTELFTSHIIYHLLTQGNVFNKYKVSGYIDVGTEKEWLQYKQ